MNQEIKEYWKIINGNDPYRIAKLNKKLSKFNFDKLKGLDFYFLKDLQNAELSIRQFLVWRLTGSFNSNRIIIKNLSSTKKFTLPFPKDWRKILEDDGLHLKSFESELLFRMFLFKMILKGTVEVLSESCKNGYKKINRPSSCLYGINKHCLPKSKIGKNYDFISWLDKENKISNWSYYHNIKNHSSPDERVIYLNSNYPRYKSTLSRLHFIIWGIFSTVAVMAMLIIGYWKTPALYFELVKRKRYEVSDEKIYFDEYIFTVSTPIYRPIWTEIIEKKNKRLRYINYSTGYPHFKTKNGYTPDEIEYNLMSWPEFQNSPGKFNEYAKKVCPKTIKTISTSPVWWSDSDYRIPIWNFKTIAVYDVPPLSEKYLPDLVPYPFYRNYENGVQFLLDILEVAEKFGFKIAYKSKRELSNIHDKKFINFLNNFNKNSNVINIPSEVSPFRLSIHTDASISMPFTTTAHIAKYINKPSVYYDPSNTLYQDDRAAESILLISNKENLNNWIASI